jgi:hypothetical protein
VSYNCDTWKTKSLVNLRIPLSAFYEHPRRDWHPTFVKEADGRERITDFAFTLAGTVLDEIFSVQEISIAGEGSGTFINWILEPALKKSTGELVAVCVWEGGDSINRLIVKDGTVTWKDIEL